MDFGHDVANVINMDNKQDASGSQWNIVLNYLGWLSPLIMRTEKEPNLLSTQSRHELDDSVYQGVGRRDN